MSLNLVKIKQVKAKEITDSFGLEELGKKLVSEAIKPADFIQALIDNESFTEAVSFLAYALPKREATWWACLCARSCLNEQSKETDRYAIKMAEAWVYKPTAENCQPNNKAAEATSLQSSAGWAAMAAFWSGDNISPVEGAVVSPADDLTAKAVIGAVMLAAVQGEADKVQDKYRMFINQGIDIACGNDGRMNDNKA